VIATHHASHVTKRGRELLARVRRGGLWTRSSVGKPSLQLLEIGACSDVPTLCSAVPPSTERLRRRALAKGHREIDSIAPWVRFWSLSFIRHGTSPFARRRGLWFSELGADARRRAHAMSSTAARPHRCSPRRPALSRTALDDRQRPRDQSRLFRSPRACV